MIEEPLFKYCYPRGEFQDTLIDIDSNVIWQTPWQPNLIVDGLRRVLAALIKGEGQALSFWAVGIGQDSWDNLPPVLPSDDERRQLTQLYRETKRKPIPAEQMIFIGGTPSNPSNQLQIRVDFFAEDIPVLGDRRLREFGLISGGTADPNTGVLINHRIHPRIDLQEGFTLQRTLRLTF
ncbi:hypothetical protein H6F61_27340 [Cyanobacteria bacterium FACHB-472]|nr:hypothetical protein [Cyanobacteria bacterium FACHB-472]